MMFSDDCFDSGSGLVSDHASKNLHKLLAKRSEFDDGEYAAAMKAALADEDGMLLDRFKAESNEPALSGSTVAACLMNLTKGDLVVSNLGDSHVILAERHPQTEHPYHIVSDKIHSPIPKYISKLIRIAASPHPGSQAGNA